MTCPGGAYSGVGGASACQPCPAGTYDPTTTGRTTVCPACPSNAYCASGVALSSCPAHTISQPGASSPLTCTCLQGYSCAYTKRITAMVVVSNSTVAGFNSDVGKIKTNLIASIAAAAGVPISQVTIVTVTTHSRRSIGGLRVRVQIDGVAPSVTASLLRRSGLLN